MIMRGPAMAADDGDGAMDPEEAADWAWARNYAQRAPEWSEEKWRRMNAILGLMVKGADRGSTVRRNPRTP